MQTVNAQTGPAAGLAVFLESLVEDGRALVSHEPLADEPGQALTALHELDRLARSHLALEAPPLSEDAAVWAAKLLYHLCRLTVCRDLGDEQIPAVCHVPCPAPRGPPTDWSADLTLRHLPRLFILARQLSSNDPLVDEIKRIATGWALSSVGMPGLEGVVLDSFVGHAALRRLYADRILACGDTSRLGHPQIDAMLRADVGIHHELAPAIAARLFQTTHEPH